MVRPTMQTRTKDPAGRAPAPQSGPERDCLWRGRRRDHPHGKPRPALHHRPLCRDAIVQPQRRPEPSPTAGLLGVGGVGYGGTFGATVGALYGPGISLYMRF